MRITAELLRELGIDDCVGSSMKDFRREWPDGMEVTQENCLRATELALDGEWVAERLLSPESLKKYRAEVALIEKEFWAAFKAAEKKLYADDEGESEIEYQIDIRDADVKFAAALAMAFWRAAKDLNRE